MKVSFDTDVGIVRSENQDSVFASSLTRKIALYIVADGMGGHRGGKTASTMAIDIISDIIKNDFDKKLEPYAIKEIMISAVKEANKQIYEKSIHDPELEGMGTTVVVMLVINRTLYIASVGDSRAYVISSQGIKQITTDHSLVADLVSRGVITEAEARVHPKRNVITRAVGSEISVEVDFFDVELDKGDIIIGCSDGLHGMLEDNEITEIVSKSNINGSAKNLIACANEKGGYDNITVVVAKIS